MVCLLCVYTVDGLPYTVTWGGEGGKGGRLLVSLILSWRAGWGDGLPYIVTEGWGEVIVCLILSWVG